TPTLQPSAPREGQRLSTGTCIAAASRVRRRTRTCRPRGVWSTARRRSLPAAGAFGLPLQDGRTAPGAPLSTLAEEVHSEGSAKRCPRPVDVNDGSAAYAHKLVAGGVAGSGGARGTVHGDSR